MSTERLNQWLSLAANIGVVVGILFLAYELRQNNNLLEAAAREAKLERRTSNSLLVASTPELAAITATLDQGGLLTPTQIVQVEALNRAILASFEWQYGEYRRGRLGFDDLVIRSWRVAFNGSGNVRMMEKTWNKWKQQASPDFVQFMHEHVVNVEE